MPMTDAFILAAIVFVFAVFGIVLAWAEYQTRHVNTRTVQQAKHDVRQNQTTTVVRPATKRAAELLDA
jgi:multisubunit Na+/H+ antiporter MnhC subunit